MTLRTIPLAPTPNQSLSVVLQERNVAVTLRTLQGSMYADVLCDGVPICTGRACVDRQSLTARAEYVGFPELVLCFADLQGTNDPQWAELGTRYVLLSVEADTVTTATTTVGSGSSDLFYSGSVMYNGSHTFDGTLI